MAERTGFDYSRLRLLCRIQEQWEPCWQGHIGQLEQMIQEIASLSFWGGGIFLGRYADGYLYGRSVKGWYDLPAPLFLKDFEVVEQLTLKDKLNLENDNWPLEFLNQQGSLLEIKMHNRLSLSIKKVIKFDEL